MLLYEDLKPYNEEEFLTFHEELEKRIKRVLPGMASSFYLTTKNVSFKKNLKTALNMIKSNSLAEFQEHSMKYLEKAVLRGVDSFDKFKVEGIENIDKSKGTIVIMNHRDIISDPFNFIYAMISNNMGIPSCGFGNNLDYWPVGHILRANNSFMIDRGKDADLMQMSKIITEIMDKKNIAWISHSAGRSKDGLDKTDSRILAMLSLYSLRNKKTKNFEEFISEYNIIPASISYEIEPCDEWKAEELFIKDGGKHPKNLLTKYTNKFMKGKLENGNYVKGYYEDFYTMIYGLRQNNKSVTISFGKPISGVKNRKDAAALINEKIIKNFHIYDSHEWAYAKIRGHESEINHEVEEHINKIIHKKPHLEKYILNMYANSYRQKIELNQGFQP